GEVVRGWLGAGNQPGAHGAAIGSVYEGTPAEKAGLRPGDVVETIDGEPVPDFESLRARVGSKAPGDVVELRVRRGESVLDVRVTLEAKPEASSLETLRPSRAPAPSAEPHARPPRPFRLPFGLHAPSEERSTPAAPGEGAGVRLGVSARPTGRGLGVVEVREGSLADTLGLRAGDVLRELDGRALAQPSDVAAALARAGDHLQLQFERDGATHVVTL